MSNSTPYLPADATVLISPIREVLFEVLGIKSDDLRFLRQSCNMVFADIGAEVVVRIPVKDACSNSLTSDSLAVLQELADKGAPIVPPLAARIIPLGHDTMTVWLLLQTGQHAPGPSLALILSELHATAGPSLPVYDIGSLRPDFEHFIQTAASLNVHAPLPSAYIADLEQAWSYVRQNSHSTNWAICHGDPYPDNTAQDSSGRIVWIDLDGLYVAPREWDLSMLRKLSRRFREAFPASADEQEMLSAYSHDFDFELFCAMNALGDFRSALGAARTYQAAPTQYNRIRAEQRIGTVSDPHASWLIY